MSHLPEGARVGCDPWVHTVSGVRGLQRKLAEGGKVTGGGGGAGGREAGRGWERGYMGKGLRGVVGWWGSCKDVCKGGTGAGGGRECEGLERARGMWWWW